MAIYSRITTYAGFSSGEFMFCVQCHENNALCPDCETEVCVFCDDECPECGESMW